MKIIKIGRAQDNDYTVNGPVVSGYHADVELHDNGEFIYIDHSTNGSMINGIRVHNSKYYIQPSDTITLPGGIILSAGKLIAMASGKSTNEGRATITMQSPIIPSEGESESQIIKPEVEQKKSSVPDIEQNEPAPIDNSKMFNHLFTARGRIRRTEYWITKIVTYLISGIPTELFLNANGGAGGLLGEDWLIYFAILAPYIYFSIVSGIKRCHDLGFTGWFMLIPIAGPVMMAFSTGENETNKYGTAPTA